MSYLKRKWLRLYPTYILMILIYFIVGRGVSINPVVDNIVSLKPIGIILNVLGLHGFSPKWINAVVPGGWYVGIIWIYLLIAPILYKYIKTTSTAVKCVFVSLLIRIVFHTLSNFCFTNVILGEWSDMFIANQFVFLTIGQMLYFLLVKKEMSIKPLDHVLLVVMMFYITLQKDTLVFWALVLVVLIIMVTSFENSVFVNKVALWFGKYSYEIYLCHIAVMYYVCKIQILKFSNMYLTLAVTFIICISITALFAVLVNRSVKASGHIFEYFKESR